MKTLVGGVYYPLTVVSSKNREKTCNQSRHQIVQMGACMYVVFVSDESITEGGFSANYDVLLVNTTDVIEAYGLSVFPNPFTNQLTIDFGDLGMSDLRGKMETMKLYSVRRSI